jgi:predicted amino acid dehydrogenase
MAGYDNDPSEIPVKNITFWAVGGILALGVGIFVASAGIGAYSRWNDVQQANNQAHVARINAANQTQVNELTIAATAQQVKIHQAQAQVRLADAVGVREAQDEISKTLTPLYVQFEMVDALKSIAESGKNNTIVYIPTGANGIPLISNTDTTQVGTPKG